MLPTKMAMVPDAHNVSNMR